MDLLKAEELAERWCKIEANPEDDQQMLDVIEALLDACGKYRSLYDGALKKMERYRDVAAKPDICVYNKNKDCYGNLLDMRRGYKDYQEKCFQEHLCMLPFDEWLFLMAPIDKPKGE